MSLYHHRSVPSTYAQGFTYTDTRIPCKREETGVRECECGRRTDTEACSHCAFLDGGSVRGRISTEAIIISALRNDRYLTLNELSERSGISRRKMLEALQRLMRTGRVSSAEEEFEVPCKVWGKGRETTDGTSMATRKLYKLESK